MTPREKTEGHEHPHTLASVSIVAAMLQYQGKYEAAKEMKALGNEHPDTPTNLYSLAFLFHQQYSI